MYKSSACGQIGEQRWRAQRTLGDVMREKDDGVNCVIFILKPRLRMDPIESGDERERR